MPLSSTRWLAAVAVASVLGVVSIGADSSFAEDRDLAFIHGLQGHGMGDIAVDYLEAMKGKPELSPGAADLYDLEMSKSLRAAAQQIADPVDRATMNAKAQQFLDKFAKEKPNHPEALQAELTTAAAIVDQGNELLALSRTLTDPKEKAAKLVAARAAFEQAKPLLETGMKKIDERIRKAGPPPPGPKAASGATADKKRKDWAAEHEHFETDRAQAEGNLALIDYYRAQTYPDPKDNDQRRKALSESFNRLDDIYQRNRDKDANSLEGRFALAAHSWSGRAAEELGDNKKASDIYDEVLENLWVFDKDHPKYVKTDVDDVLARTKHFSLLLMLKDPKQAGDYEAQARDFVEGDQYKKNLMSEWGFQAATLELAKHIVADSEKATKPSEKKKLFDEAVKMLKEMAGVRSEFQREAMLLRNKMMGGAEETAQTADEALGYADTHLKKGDYEGAAKWLKKAQELMVGKKNDPLQAAHITELIAGCELAPINEEYAAWRKKNAPFDKDKFLAWYEGYSKITRNPEYKKTDTARDAASRAVYCAAMLYGSASAEARNAHGVTAKAVIADRDAANKRLADIADFVITAYPKSTEADDARMSLARTTLMDGKLTEALAAFEGIDPKSEKYSEALIAAGKVRYSRYFAEKKKDPTKRDQKQMDDDRKMAIEHLAEAIPLIMKTIKPGDPVPESLLETQLLLAQIYMEGDQNKEALAILEPLVKAITAANPKELDDMMLEVFRSAVKVHLGMGNFDKAGEAGGVLIDLGPDNPRINSTLVQFIQKLDAERRKIQDTLNTLPDSTPPAELERLRNNLTSVKTMLGNMLLKMAKREQLTAMSMIYIGRLFNDLDMSMEAEQQFRGLLKKADEDPDFKKEAEKSFAWVRAQQIGLLRKQGKYQEAFDNAEKLAKEYKGALEPIVEQAQILQAWGEKDPANYDKAISRWTEIRRKLERQQPRPAAYYDSVYNTAMILLLQAKKLMPVNKEAALEKGRTGEKVINSLLIGQPNLDGTTDTKAKFTKLKNQLIILRGGKPETNATAPGARPAPAPAAARAAL